MIDAHAKVAVRFCGLARDWAGVGEKTAVVDARPALLPETLAGMMQGRRPATMQIFVNGRRIDYLTDNNLRLQDGDLIAIIPTISGG
jgi:molybdopterin converting factor small subunit